MTLTGTNPLHDQGNVHPGQRWQSDIGQVLRQECVPHREGTESVRKESLQQNASSQCGNHHVGRTDLRLQEQCRSVLLRDGQHARKRADPAFGAELPVRYGHHDPEEECGEASGARKSRCCNAGL